MARRKGRRRKRDAAGETVADLSRSFKVSRATVYRVLDTAQLTETG